MKDNVKALLKEPSTWAGIAAIVIAVSGFDAFTVEQIAAGLAGIAAILLPEVKA